MPNPLLITESAHFITRLDLRSPDQAVVTTSVL